MVEGMQGLAVNRPISSRPLQLHRQISQWSTCRILPRAPPRSGTERIGTPLQRSLSCRTVAAAKAESGPSSSSSSVSDGLPSTSGASAAAGNGALVERLPSSREASGNGATLESSTSGRDAPPPQYQTKRKKKGVEVRVEGMLKEFKTRDGTFRAADYIDLVVEPNTMVALLGPSGSGKTTLLRLVAGLEDADAGRVYFDGEDLTDVPVQDRGIGFVFQGYALFKHMTVADNITFSPRMRKENIDMKKRAEELLELVELPGYGNRLPSQLSGGQRQRVALARALASNPRVLLLDEPFGALDPQVRSTVRAQLKAIIDRVGVTSILVTHDQEEAFDIADKVVIFNKGRIAQQGEPGQLARNPMSPFVMHFIGDVNQMPSDCKFVRKMGFQTDKPFAMCRPADVEVSLCPLPHVKRLLPATVVDKINVGWQVKYFLQFIDGVKVEMHVDPEVDLVSYNMGLGDRVFVRVKPMCFMGFTLEELDYKPIH